NNIEYRRYEALDHGLKDRDGKSQRKEIVSDMNMWLRSKLGNPANKSSGN
ncbi:TPA: alpha/beta hydrolase, partial [Aeromonas hydrophila]|nr:alpha/beta hydrolase [Aeromonas hydrophila]